MLRNFGISLLLLGLLAAGLDGFRTRARQQPPTENIRTAEAILIPPV